MNTFTTRPTLSGTFGMVGSTHWIASAVAMRTLEAGGNAFDAAAAGAFTLHVVEPHLNGPAGEVPAIVAQPGRPARVLMGQGPAPEAATPEHLRGLGLQLVPGSGPIAAAVPGAFDAWLLLLRDLGTADVADVFEPAIGYARSGVPVLPQITATISAARSVFEQHWPTSAATWLPGGRVPQPGELLRNPVWADTLERLLASAGRGDREARIDAVRRTWREGFVAESIEEFCATPFRDASGADHAGLLTVDDLAGYRAGWEDPVSIEWHGYTIAKAGPWCQGPVLLQTLATLRAAGESYDVDSAGGMHTVTEAIKLAMADREAWYGDGFDTPLDALLSDEYARDRAGLIGDDASLEVRPGAPDGRTPRLPSPAGSGDADTSGIGEPTVDTRAGAADGSEPGTRGDTCHIDVADRWGNLISATPSGGWLQSSPVIPELGFALGTRLQMTWLEEGLASTLRPGRRPRSTLTPTMVLRGGIGGDGLMACGTPGGDQQDQWQTAFLIRTLIHELPLQAAIDAPAFHTESFPSSFFPRAVQPGALVVEERVPAGVRTALQRRGHDVRSVDGWSLGRLSAVRRDPESGMLRAAANPRGMQGYAIGR